MIIRFAVLHHINRPENPFMKERDFLDIDEFCVDAGHRRKGVASEMISFNRLLEMFLKKKVIMILLSQFSC